MISCTDDPRPGDVHMVIEARSSIATELGIFPLPGARHLGCEIFTKGLMEGLTEEEALAALDGAAAKLLRKIADDLDPEGAAPKEGS